MRKDLVVTSLLPKSYTGNSLPQIQVTINQQTISIKPKACRFFHSTSLCGSASFRKKKPPQRLTTTKTYGYAKNGPLLRSYGRLLCRQSRWRRQRRQSRSQLPFCGTTSRSQYELRCQHQGRCIRITEEYSIYLCLFS